MDRRVASPPLIALPTGQENHPLYFAQFGKGLGQLFSQILLFNLDTEMEASAEIQLKDDDGQPLSVDLDGNRVDGELSLKIPASGLRVLKTDAEGPLVTGSVTVSSDKALAGVILFGGSVGVAGVGSSVELPNGFVAPMQTSTEDGLNSGIAVMNLENVQVRIDLELFDLDGNRLATAQLELDGMGHRSLFVNELVWNPMIDFSQFQGILKASAAGRIAATVIQTNPGQFATMPVVPQ